MKHPFKFTLILLAGLFILLTSQGCLGKKETVKLIPANDPVPCRDMLTMNLADIQDEDFNLALDTTFNGPEFHTCWKPLMKKALTSGKKIPKHQLAKAIHVFNRNDSKSYFSAAVYLYFKEILNGNGSYGKPEKKLMVEYLSFTIQNAATKQDEDLKNAKLICSRLDPELYGKYFL